MQAFERIGCNKSHDHSGLYRINVFFAHGAYKWTCSCNLNQGAQEINFILLSGFLVHGPINGHAIVI